MTDVAIIGLGPLGLSLARATRLAFAEAEIVGFDPEFQNELRQNILLAGGGSQIRGLGEEVRSNLSEFGPCRVTIVDDPIYAGALGALKLAQDMPESEWRRYAAD